MDGEHTQRSLAPPRAAVLLQSAEALALTSSEALAQPEAAEAVPFSDNVDASGDPSSVTTEAPGHGAGVRGHCAGVRG